MASFWAICSPNSLITYLEIRPRKLKNPMLWTALAYYAVEIDRCMDKTVM
jgi:hypothetical protein